MLLILLFHFSVYSGIDEEAAGLSAKIFLWIFQYAGKVGVNAFLMVSAWFLCMTGGFKPSKFVRVWLPLFFWVAFVGLFFHFLPALRLEYNLYYWRKTLLPFTTNSLWYATMYLTIYCMSPMLNAAVRGMDRKAHKWLLLCMFILFSVVPFLTNGVGPFDDQDSFLYFVFVYMFIAYIRKYDLKLFRYQWTGWLMFLLSWTGMYWLGVWNEAAELDLAVRTNYTPLMLTCALGLFTAFKNMKAKPNAAVNVIASATFGIYILHEHDFLRKIIWQGWFYRTKEWYYQQPTFIPYAIGVALLVFVAGAVLDLARQYLLERPLFALVDVISSRTKAKKAAKAKAEADRAAKIARAKKAGHRKKKAARGKKQNAKGKR
jgi:surface polysaccharide O-acyltransferase-like enzyme